MTNKKYYVLLLGALLIATFFRLYQLHVLPGGLFPDEAANGLDINLMEQGQLQPFYERGNGREALFFYILWAGVKFFGRTPFAHHLVSAMVGILATILCYLVTKKLFLLASSTAAAKPETSDQTTKLSGNNESTKTITSLVPAQGLGSAFLLTTKPTIVALLATFLMATSTWHIVLSRTAFRANLVPLLATACLWALLGIHFAKNRKLEYVWSGLFGAAMALGMYSYIAYRIMLPLVFILVLWPLLGALRRLSLVTILKKYAPLLLVSIASFILVIAPLGNYFYQNPDWLVGRSGQVSVFNPDWNKGDLVGTVLETSRLSLLAYFADGDLNWRHNISGFPFLSPIISPFFGFGLLLALYGAIRYALAPNKQSRYFPQFLLIGWFISFLVPVITTAEGIPHGLRAIGTIPAVFILTAYGMYWVSSRVWRMVILYPHGSPRMEKLLQTSLKILVVCFVVAITVQTYVSYFIYSANSAENYFAFRSDLTVVSKYLNEYGNRDNTYLVLDKFSVQTVDYLTTKNGKTACDRESYFRTPNCVEDPTNKPYNQVDPEDSWRSVSYIKDGTPLWINGLNKGDQIVFTESSIFDIKKFKASHPSAKLEREVRNKFGQAVLAVYRLQ